MFKQLKESLTLQFLILTIIILSHMPLPHLMLPAKPDLVSITIFYFSIFEQTRLPVISLFILGLFQDFLGHNIIGISSLSYVIMAMFASSNRRTLSKQKFIIIWCAFLITIIIIKIISIMAESIAFHSDYMKLMHFSDQIITILLYPTIHWFYTKYINIFRGNR